MRIPPTSNISIDHDRQSSTAQASYCNSICRAKFFRFTKSLFIQYSKSKHRKSLGALHWSGNVYFNFVLFLFRLFRMVIGLEVVDVCVCIRRINCSSACNFKINRLSGWRELVVMKLIFILCAVCHIAELCDKDLCIVFGGGISNDNSTTPPIFGGLKKTAFLAIGKIIYENGNKTLNVCARCFASNKQQLDYNLMHAELNFCHRMDLTGLIKWV